MAYFKEQPVKRVVLPSDANYWVDLATDYRYGDVKKFVASSPDGEPDLSTTGDVFLLTAIKAWNLDDDTGTILEITSDNLDKLSKDDAVFLINQASGILTEEDTKKKESSSK